MNGMRWLALAVAAGALAVLSLPRSMSAADTGLPGPFVAVSHGPAGGTIWSGRIPNTVVPGDARASAIYLPPGFDRARRYPVVYLLHGMRGSPSGFYRALHLANVADGLITSGRTPPFIAVMPAAGPRVNPGSGEWAGVWETYVVRDVVPWVDAQLRTIATPKGRALAGLSAGGFGAMDIGLRNPGIFGTLESWGGYFAPVFHDGPFVGATAADLQAHTPTLLVRRSAAALRRAGTRFYLSTGSGHGKVQRAWTLQYARELATLGLRYQLWLLPPADRGHFYSATLPTALEYAGSGFAAASTS
jgi:enterochelin esterase-like enzyme